MEASGGWRSSNAARICTQRVRLFEEQLPDRLDRAVFRRPQTLLATSLQARRRPATPGDLLTCRVKVVFISNSKSVGETMSIADQSGGSCIQCGQKPGKPKFCSRSCAAKHNNAFKPKRGPEGKCIECGIPIRTTKKRCDTCLEQALIIQKRKDLNIKSFCTITGERKERSFEKAYLEKTVVYEARAFGFRTFTTKSKCEDFLNALSGIVSSKPEYVRTDDVGRYVAWIDHFSNHVIRHSWGRRSGDNHSVRGLEIRDLGYALYDWIEDILRSQNHVLYPTYALDAARFINAHAFGLSSDMDEWKIVGLVNAQNDDEWVTRERLDNPTLKKDITQAIKWARVKCLTPEGATIIDPEAERNVVSPGDVFDFEIERCHLTRDSIAPPPFLRANEAIDYEHDIASDMWFRGRLPLAPEVGSLSEYSYFYRAEIPIRWITHVYEFSTGTEAPVPVPIPIWTIEE
ncbi:MAG: hypothetical protein QM811_15305 [Pirellulales bacterium]